MFHSQIETDPLPRSVEQLTQLGFWRPKRRPPKWRAQESLSQEKLFAPLISSVEMKLEMIAPSNRQRRAAVSPTGKTEHQAVRVSFVLQPNLIC